MKKAWLYLAAIGVLLVLGLAGFLYTWDIPAPTQKVEKTLPDDRFPR